MSTVTTNVDSARQPQPGRPVPKELVHKHHACQVLLKDWRRNADGTFSIPVDWHRATDSFAPLFGHISPALLVETVRQSFPLLAHVGHEVPLGHHLLWDEFRYTCTPSALRSVVQRAPQDVELHVTCTEAQYRGKRASFLAFDIDVLADGIPLARAHSRFPVLAPAVYRRIRPDAGDGREAMARAVPLPPPLPHQPLGVGEFHDVALSPTDRPQEWLLRVDVHHPFYFDHPVDHAPGTLLLEAARQAAQELHPRLTVIPAGQQALFSRYVELDQPCTVTAEPAGEDDAGRPVAHVRMVQSGQEYFRSSLTLADAQQR
ncbi:ScbA/BarX family gamma-butyrolactone biosynthesis protein [Streptomyces sp. NPDC102381]|uniref:ScbA/BarX family gamma-butyrolactone biosynthesis protein n=1 Tax=Streptomyces sp. NPDC102381 TaxID=3366164 RepID=UPI0038270E08